MKRVISIIILVMTCPSWGEAQSTSTRTHPLKKKFYQINTSYQLWQENIDVSSAGSSSKMRTQFHGFKAGGSYNKPHKNVRWVESYGLDLGLGIAKGEAASPLTDQVKDQPWISLSFTPGITYRGTSKSEVGFVLPVIYRFTMWDIQDPFSINEKALSVGLGGVYVQRFNYKSSFYASVVHQQMWNATVWSIGFQFNLR